MSPSVSPVVCDAARSYSGIWVGSPGNAAGVYSPLRGNADAGSKSLTCLCTAFPLCSQAVDFRSGCPGALGLP